jgi:hypothetical protein
VTVREWINVWMARRKMTGGRQGGRCGEGEGRRCGDGKERDVVMESMKM